MAGRYPKCMTDAIAYGMDNAALVMDELEVSERTIEVLNAFEREVIRTVFPRITRQGQERMRMHVQVLRAGLNRQMDLDRKDYATGRSLNLHIGEMAKKRTARQSGPVQLSATQR